MTYADARSWLKDFVDTRLRRFGDYEDAIVANESTLFHGVLTPLLNISLLTPREVLDEVLAAENIPLNSREGFVRQLIGWREFMRAAYIRWCDVWDGLFWSFIARHREFFAGNVRIGPLASQIERMDPAKLGGHQANAARFLAGLHRGDAAFPRTG